MIEPHINLRSLSMKTQINKVVRVAVNNNFNCTDAEFQQLDTFAAAYPDTLFFINSNVRTKLLTNINKHPYKAVLTLNPDLSVDKKHVTKLKKINNDRIAFIRIKYFPGNPEILSLIKEISKDYPVVITNQRFNSENSATSFVPDFRKHYKWSSNRFRLYGKSLKKVEDLVDSKKIFICDQAGLGCGGCGLCSKLTTKMDLPIYTMNLSSSGLCPFNCVDCYAKTIQHYMKGRNGDKVIRLDNIYMNSKQSGRTKHIKANQAKL
jgi:hypothetical protein